MYHPTDRIAHTTAFVTPVVEHWLHIYIHKYIYIHTAFNIYIYIYIYINNNKKQIKTNQKTNNVAAT